MTVVNFNFNEIKASKNVKQFYKSLKFGGEPYTTTWHDTIVEFDNEDKMQKELERVHKDKKCSWCDASCVVRRVKKENRNKGRWFITCSNGNSNERCHHFEWIP